MARDANSEKLKEIRREEEDNGCEKKHLQEQRDLEDSPPIQTLSNTRGRGSMTMRKFNMTET